MAKSKSPKMLKRILTGIVLSLLTVIILWADQIMEHYQVLGQSARGVLFAAVMAILALLGGFEFFRLAEREESKPLKTLAVTTAIILLWFPILSLWFPFLVPVGQAGILSAAFLLMFMYQAASRQAQGALKNIAFTAFFVIYVGLLGSYAVRIGMEWGGWALAMYIAVVKGGDSGAYLVGSAFGRHKLIPWLSPNKTWEGLVGALMTGVVIALAFGLAPNIMEGWSIWSAAVFGLILGLIGLLGDLGESLLKRDAQVKDTADLVPTFGGILDIVDSLLPTAPIAYLMLSVFGIK
jgi:phosphatidate cytidylyltransferase